MANMLPWVCPECFANLCGPDEAQIDGGRSVDGSPKMAVPEEVQRLIAQLPQPKQNGTLNRLNASFNLWRRYYGFLRIIGERHSELERAFLRAMQRQHELVQREIAAGTGPRQVTPEEIAEDVRTAAITSRLHLELESFYIFAKILVDRMADTFAFYFRRGWRPAGSTHTQLTNSLERLCTNEGYLLSPEDLLHILREVRTRIVQYRTDDIEHVSEPGLMHATIYHLSEGKARIAPNVVCPSDPEAAGRKYAEKRTEVPEELFPLIESYMTALVRFFAANADRSVAVEE